MKQMTVPWFSNLCEIARVDLKKSNHAVIHLTNGESWEGDVKLVSEDDIVTVTRVLMSSRPGHRREITAVPIFNIVAVTGIRLDATKKP